MSYDQRNCMSSSSTRPSSLCICFSIYPSKEFEDILNSDQQNNFKNIYHQRSITFCKQWHLNGLILGKERRANWNITHLSIMDKLYHIYINCSRVHSSGKNQQLEPIHIWYEMNVEFFCIYGTTTVTLKAVGYTFSRYQTWNRITRRSTRNLWKVLFRFL